MATINITSKIIRFIIILCGIYLVYSIFFKRKIYETMIYKDDDIIRSKNATALLNTMENEWGNYTINIEENLNSDLSDKLQIEEGKIRAIIFYLITELILSK